MNLRETKSTFVVSLLAILGVTVTFDLQVRAAPFLRTVAVTGDPAPGAASSAKFGNVFNPPHINNAGDTAFSGLIQTGSGDVTSANDLGIWSEGQTGSLRLVAREGQQAANLPVGAVFDGSSIPLLSDTGEVVFFARLRIGTGGVNSGNNFAVFSEYGGGLHPIARNGDPAPDAPVGAVYGGLDMNITLLVQNSIGQSAFRTELWNGPGGVTQNDAQAIWSEGSGQLRMVAREGSSAPGTSNGSVFTSFGVPGLNSLGQTAFSAELGRFSGNVTDKNNFGIWSDRDGSLKLLVRTGDQVPGVTPGIVLSSFTSNTFNDAGQIAFQGFLHKGEYGVTPENDTGIWAERNGALQLIVRESDQAPGVQGGAKFSFEPYYSATPVFNNAGKIAFHSQLAIGSGEVDATNNEGIWSEGFGELALIARKGEHAPGAPPEAHFVSFANYIELNSAGQVAFEATVGEGNGGSDSSNRGGIWAQDRNGTLRLIACEGDQLDIDDGPGIDLRTISSLYFLNESGNRDANFSGFNDVGQLAFVANFVDGTSGVFVSDLASVPEPATAFLIFSGFAGISTIATRRRR